MLQSFSPEEAQELVDSLILAKTGKHLSDVESLILKESWKNKKYEEIGQEYGYSGEYLQKDIGNKLWKKLTDVLGEEVSKRNFKEALKRKWSKDKEKSSDKSDNFLVNSHSEDLSFPDGLVPLTSNLYMEREGNEGNSYSELFKKGSLIRIKAPHLMGKTSLMIRLLDYAQKQGYHATYLDFKEIGHQKLNDLEQLLQWICFQVGRQLKLKNCLKDYWDTDILGSNDNCTVYFEDYLIPSLNSPLVLGLDNVDLIFPYSAVIDDFFGMLRSWHEKGKTDETWQQIRLIIAHSTEAYITLDLNQSPFNAGFPVELQEFNIQQIESLAQQHGLNLSSQDLNQLMKIIGGHPHLVRLGLYYLKKEQMALEDLLKNASTEAGKYSNHLRSLQSILKQNLPLAEAYKKVVNSEHPSELNSSHTYQLHSLGLVKRYENYVTPSCALYHQYFQRVL